jgi:hypothetical protein
MVQSSYIEKPNMLNLLKTLPSAIAFDIAKDHTGIAIWNGESIEQYGFLLESFNENDVHGYYRMRLELKNKIKDIVKDRHFEYCMVEDLFGGPNFTTLRMLCELQTVPDELLFEGVFTTNTFFRWKEPEWSSLARKIYKHANKLQAKYETQMLLEYLEYDFVLNNKDKRPGELKDMFYEDICDASAMLIAIVAAVNFKVDKTKSSSHKMSDLKLNYVEDFDEIEFLRDKDKLLNYEIVEIDTKNIEASIIAHINSQPDKVFCASLPPKKLGVFGLKHKFEFYESNQGYLFFYVKGGS